jgi:enediyne core biosynthesis thioesterase
VSSVVDRYVYHHRVTFDETNLVGNVYFAHYLHWQGHCREHFLADYAPRTLADLDDGLALMTVSCSVDYYAECRALDLVEVHMLLEGMTGNRITMAFDYLRTASGAAELLARGRQTVACLRREGQHLRPVPVPDELRDALAGFAEPHRPEVRTR